MLNTLYLIIASEGRSQGRMKQRRHKVVASIKAKNQHSPVKTKKMTKPKNKPNTEAMDGVEVGPPRLQRPQRALIRRKEKKSSYGL
jgi:hypothetical protein